MNPQGHARARPQPRPNAAIGKTEGQRLARLPPYAWRSGVAAVLALAMPLALATVQRPTVLDVRLVQPDPAAPVWPAMAWQDALRADAEADFPAADAQVLAELLTPPAEPAGPGLQLALATPQLMAGSDSPLAGFSLPTSSASAPPADPTVASAAPVALSSRPEPWLAGAPPMTAATAAQAQLAAAPAAVSRSPAASAGADGRFDLAVNNAPAAQVFLQLAQGTAYNMLVSPDVSGTLTVNLKDTTVPDALDTLRELFGYEYRITGNRVFIYPNTVQTRLYKINYLPGRRQGTSDIRVSSSAITQGSSGGSSTGSSGTSSGNGTDSSGGNGSQQRQNNNAQVHTSSDADFWREVQASLQSLVGTHGGRSVVLNPAAGVVVVKATPAELRQVEGYLKAVQISIERQVMLEAKIVEVSLSKDAQTGINWAGFGKLGSGQLTLGSGAPGSIIGNSGNLTGGDGTVAAPGVSLAPGALGRGFYGLAFQAANFAALLNFLQTQGDVQVLSSPRIATMNNQKAVLKVGSDELYVTGVSSSTTSSGNSTVSSPSVTLQPFFSGISLDVTPQIDDAGNVILHVHPTISSVTEKNKNIDLGSLGSFRLPLASSSVNETDSIVRVRDGQIVAIGGLMKVETRDERTGLPVLSDAPVFGGLFRQTTTVQSKRELVIMLKPTVIQNDGVWPEANSLAGVQPSMMPALPAAPATQRR